MTKQSRILSLIIAIILILSLGIRIYAPLADLPSDISISGSVYTDEGNQCHNSRSKILYGKWYEDDWQITRYNPILPYVKYGIFKVFGVGFLQVRSVSIFFSILILLFMYLIFRSHYSQLLALLGTALTGLNFFIIMYGKIGTFEIPMIFWMIFSLYFVEKYRGTNKSYFLFLAGTTAFMSLVFKNISVYFVPVPFMAYLFYVLFNDKKEDIFSKKNLKNYFLIIIGVLSVFLTWLILFYLPNKEWIMSAPGKYIGNQVIPKNISQAIGNFFAFNWKEQFFKIPVIWSISILYLPVFYRKLILKKSNITEMAFAFFFLSHTVFFMFMNHRPTRYLLPVIFAMIFMVIKFFSYLIEKKDLHLSNLSSLQKTIFTLLDSIWIILAVYFCFSPLLFKYFDIFHLNTISAGFIIASIVISILVNFIITEPIKKIRDLFQLKKVSYIIVFTLFIISLIFNIYHLNKWNENKTYSVLNINNDLKKNLKNAFIAGLTAPVSVLESDHRSLFLYPDFVNWNNDGTANDTFNKYPISHALLASFNKEISDYFRYWPKRMQNARLIKNYSVKEQFLHLYSFKYPYIDRIIRLDKNNFELIIKNPGPVNTEIFINEIYFKKNNKNEYINKADVFIKHGKEKIILNKGTLNDHSITTIKITLNGTQIDQCKSVLFNIDRSMDKEVLRYEGEKFPGRTGSIKRIKNCSENYVRSFIGKKDKKGFLIHGPYEPFEYTEGFVKAEFNVSFNSIRNSISPVCTLDIFDYDKQLKLSEKVLIPKKDKIELNKFMEYSICAYIPKTKKIEFRLKTIEPGSNNKLIDINIDYVDITYYPGKTFYFEN